MLPTSGLSSIRTQLPAIAEVAQRVLLGNLRGSVAPASHGAAFQFPALGSSNWHPLTGIGTRNLTSATPADASSNSAQSVALQRPSPNDKLSAALAKLTDWVQSPGSTEVTGQRLADATCVHLSVELPRDAHPVRRSETLVGASLLAAQLLADGKAVRFTSLGDIQEPILERMKALGMALPEAMSDAEANNAHQFAWARGVQRGESQVLLRMRSESPASDTKSVTTVGAVAETKSESHADAVLGPYPSVQAMLSAARSAAAQRTQHEALGSHSFSRVSGPSGGDATLAVLGQYLANRYRGDPQAVNGRMPSPSSFADLRTKLLQADPEGGSSLGRESGATLTKASAHARAELLRAISMWSARPTPSVALPKETYCVVAFDSSNGGLIAAKNAGAYLRDALKAQGVHKDVNVVVFTDHGNATYGGKTLEELKVVVAVHLGAADVLDADAVMMACNTACTSFPTALEHMRTASGEAMPVIDLIETTSEQIVLRGGQHPALFATVATVNNRAYQDALETRGRALSAAIGCEEWAGLVNERKHLSDDPAVRSEVRAVVSKYVGQLPEATTSVWLCCTHYPALKGFIEQSLGTRFPDRKVTVFDPMPFQAQAVADALSGVAPRAPRPANAEPFVMTTGDPDDVKESARQLLDIADPAVYPIRSNALIPGGSLASAAATGIQNLSAEPVELTDADQIQLAQARRHSFGLPTSQTMSLLEAVTLRGVDLFRSADGPKRLAREFAQCQRAMLITGFSVAEGLPETDGPPGTAVLAKSLASAGKSVTVVADPTNLPVMRACLDSVLSEEERAFVKLVLFSDRGDKSEHSRALLAEFDPQIVVAVELPGRNADGDYLNAFGKSVAEFNAGADELLRLAGESGLLTGGVADGGNEAGIGGQRGIPLGNVDGKSFNFASTITSANPVTAWNSNFGAVATAIEFALRSNTKVPSASQLSAALGAAVKAGAVDGLTRENTRWVDGFSDRVHRMFFQLYVEAAQAEYEATR